MAKNPLIELEEQGQSVWLDYLSRSLIDSHKLSKLIKEDHLKGVTSNPNIFEKAIAQSDDYRAAIEDLCRDGVVDAKDVYEDLAIKDIQDACDLLLPVYQETGQKDGFASLEVSPHLAFDSQSTIEEAESLYRRVGRENLMIKVPGTDEGNAAIRTLIARGINVNVTLLFSVEAYRKAASAYLAGLEDRSKQGLPIGSIHSVASFFISRIDSHVDKKLEGIISSGQGDKKIELAKGLLGKVAIANAKMAYKTFKDIEESELYRGLSSKGAWPQRLLWASTSTKNERYSDVLYVEALVGENTINTMPLETLEAFRHHGVSTSSITEGIEKAQDDLAHLHDLSIDFKACCQELLVDGIKIFSDAFDKLLSAIEQKVSTAVKSLDGTRK